jgi:hypothetical protein
LKFTLNILNKDVGIFGLTNFRILFGVMMFLSTLRFYFNGWIEELYINPQFQFKYFGFSWVEVPSNFILYSLFITLVISSLLVALGLFYRVAIITFFLVFSYVELMDLTYYLNHYYFVSLIAFILIFLPANSNVSLDANFGFVKRKTAIPNWCLIIIKIQLSIVYFYAGLAKLNYDWLIEALPLKIWLAPHTGMPIIGSLMDEPVTAYFFSWGGALFDLSVVFLLWIKKTRLFGYFLVVIFHVFTAMLFPIGVFPYVMIVSTLIFFSPQLHERVVLFFTKKKQVIISTEAYKSNTGVKYLFIAFIIIQLLFPFRPFLYKGDLFWSEQGYRFSWRVMLMEKAGYATFYVYPYGDDRRVVVNNSDFLTPQQEKMMSTQPDFMVQYAHFLGKKYTFTSTNIPKVTADVYVSLNGQGSRRFVKEGVDLMTKHNSIKEIDWLENY